MDTRRFMSLLFLSTHVPMHTINPLFFRCLFTFLNYSQILDQTGLETTTRRCFSLWSVFSVKQYFIWHTILGRWHGISNQICTINMVVDNGFSYSIIVNCCNTDIKPHKPICKWCHIKIFRRGFALCHRIRPTDHIKVSNRIHTINTPIL